MVTSAGQSAGSVVMKKPGVSASLSLHGRRAGGKESAPSLLAKARFLLCG
ncbi:hypothetical protein [Pseudomonas nitroreducens]